MEVKKYIIWDFYGTLGYRDGGWKTALYETLTEFDPGVELNPNKFVRYLINGFPWHNPEKHHGERNPEEWWSRLNPTLVNALRQGAKLDVKTAEKLSQRVRPVYLNPEKWVVFDDSIPNLRKLKDNGWNQVILTNQVPDFDEIIDYLGLGGFFDKIYTSARIGWEKPHPMTYNAVLNDIGSRTKTWMIGDSVESDCLGPERSGIPAILVRKPNEKAERYAETLDDIHKYLDNETVANPFHEAK